MKQVFLNGLSVEEFTEGLIQRMIEELKGYMATSSQPIEIIDRPTLLKKLGITEPTCIRWEKKGKIPVLRIGSSVRYNWPAVVKALENER
jgi:predicted DNA-binding transcriptional regulator AlpA